MSRRRILIGLIALGGVAGALLGSRQETPAPPEPTAKAQPDAPSAANARKPPPDLRQLAEGAMGAAPPVTPEQQAEEAGIVRQQVGDAIHDLHSPDQATRVVGAEQLSAYPTAEAERALTQSLLEDRDPEVRATAATSLAFREKLQGSTIDALTAAAFDEADDVRNAALSTLDRYLNHEAYGSNRTAQLLANLKKSLKRVKSSNVRDDVQSFIDDHSPN